MPLTSDDERPTLERDDDAFDRRELVRSTIDSSIIDRQSSVAL
jgi:hypothetical protein